MKRGLTILTALLFAAALALPAMAQSTDTGSNKEAPASGAMANPGTMGSESANNPSSSESSAQAGSEEMKPEQKPADSSAQQQPKSDSNTASNPAENSSTGTTSNN